MINNDYVRGYFDAHGIISNVKPNMSFQAFRVQIRETNLAQLKRVMNYLLGQGYHPRVLLDDTGHISEKSRRWVMRLYRQKEVHRFAEEIGSERPEWQERFVQIKR